jgi:hypothetical protein
MDNLGYRTYTSKAGAHKAFNILCGIVDVIIMDNSINESEL